MKAFFIALLTIGLFSCKKENSTPSINISGNWKMVETFDNYKTGSFQWNPVPDSVKIIMTFDEHQSYKLSQNNQYIYTGNYTVNNAEKKVTITRPDGTADYIFYISEYANSKLTVDYHSNGNLYRQKLVKQ
jgi:hypothetical protein